jgi:hypothetical protein
MEPIQKKFKRSIRDILYSTYFGDQIRYQEEGVSVEKDILALVTDYNSIISGDGFIAEVPLPIQSAKMFGLDPITKRRIEVDDDLMPLSFEEILKDTFQQLIDDLIFTAHTSLTESKALLVLDTIKDELKKFQVLVLEEKQEYREKRFGMFWGNFVPEVTRSVISKYLDLTNSHTKTGIAYCPELATTTLRSISVVIPLALERISKLESVLKADENEEEVINNNGIFYYLGPNQVAAIESFLGYDNQGIVPKDQLKEWVEFLSGRSIPQRPITWLKPETHFAYLVRHAAHILDTGKNFMAPIQFMSSQVPWKQLMEHVQLENGERLSSTARNAAYHYETTLSKPTTKYLGRLFESYHGED